MAGEKTSRGIEHELINAGMREEIAAQIAGYVLESARRERPALLTSYLRWRRAYEAERSIDPALLQREVALLALRPELSKEDAALLEPEEPKTEPPAKAQPTPHEALVQRYLALLLKGDRKGAHQLILEALDGGLSIEALYVEVMQAVLYQIGDRWQRNQLSVGQEHFCTAAIQATMAHLYPQILSTIKKDRILVATSVAGNLHEVGIRMVADLFELDGWDSYYLGADCPAEDIVASVESKQAHLLAVSATMVPQLTELERLLDRVRARLGADFPVLVGGRLFISMPDLWQELGASAFAPTASEAVQAGNRLLEPRDE